MRFALSAFCFLPGLVASIGLADVPARARAESSPATRPSTTQPVDPHADQSLIQAIERGDAKAAREAIDAGAYVDGVPQLTPPLIVAVSCQKIELVRLLLDEGASANVAQPPCMRTPLMMLRAGKEREKILDLLVAHGVDLNVTDWGGRTLLARAACSGNIELIKLLLDRGANPCVRDAKGMSPLQVARENHHDAAADLLIKRGGADVY